ncbi:MAG: hypothetical protein ACD_62C00460G0002 [uncultured bacterium]|nr:MAG: hypothetical protein ACD_62C00460G0002 [uncultured bacterium]HLD44711.1 sigma-54 dependent transcriptional regulator [bacterium]
MSYNILCVDDDPRFLIGIRAALMGDYAVFTAENFDVAANLLNQNSIDVVLLDLELQTITGLEALKLIKARYPDVEVLMLSGYKNPKDIVEAMRAGASDYLTKDTCPEEIIVYINKLLKNKEIKDRYSALIESTKPEQVKLPFMGKAKAFEKILSQARRLKGINAHVLIEGESGTGKELLARYIHDIESDPKRPFIAVNCAAIPENVLESDLFGHEKGSFTGATERKIGKFELADNGDILLDEINSLKIELQGKILRALEEKEFYRVGSIKPISVNFRVIACANVCLSKLVAEGKFREDLYHRLHVIALCIPPLRERRDDILGFINHFTNQFSQYYQRMNKKTFTDRALQFLYQYAWPGNVRELKNLIQSLTIMCERDVVDVCDLPHSMLTDAKIKKEGVATQEDDKDSHHLFSQFDKTLNEFRLQAERQYVKCVIKANQGNKTRAAKVLGVSRPTLHAKIRLDEVTRIGK